MAQAIGAVVTQLRVERNWSQADLSVRSGYGRSWVSRFENGRINPTLELVIAFADSFELKLSQFFARAERKHSRRQPVAPAAKSKKRN
jgi:putative transcriptional regulator